MQPPSRSLCHNQRVITLIQSRGESEICNPCQRIPNIPTSLCGASPQSGSRLARLLKMSSSQVASSQANQREANELMSEIAFQKVLLSSIDDSVENREDAETEIRAEIKTLEKKLRALRRGNTSASQSTTIPPSQTAASTTSTSKPRADFTTPAMDDFPTAGSQNGYQGALAEAEVCFFCYMAGRKAARKIYYDSFYFISIHSYSIITLSNNCIKPASRGKTSPQPLPPHLLQTPPALWPA